MVPSGDGISFLGRGFGTGAPGVLTLPELIVRGTVVAVPSLVRSLVLAGRGTDLYQVVLPEMAGGGLLELVTDIRDSEKHV